MTLNDLHPTTRFSDRVADYVRYRPGYPPGLVPLLADAAGLRPGWVVADLGSGTGLSAYPFLRHGHPVLAVEPNAEMRAAAEARLRDVAGFTSVAGRAEETGLPDACADLVVAGQAFHWFDRDAARRECVRILRPPRPVAVFWNNRLTDASDLARGYESILERFGTDYRRVARRNLDATDLGSFFSGPVRHHWLPNEQSLDYPGLEGRLLSSSYAPHAGRPDHAPMLRELRLLFDRHARDGVVRLEYHTDVFTGTLDGGGGSSA